LARELIILPRFKRDYRNARKHAEFNPETLEYVLDALICGERLLVRGSTKKTPAGPKIPPASAPAYRGVCETPGWGRSVDRALRTINSCGGALPAFDRASQGAIDGLGEQIPITEPCDGFGSRGAVVNDPALGPIGAVSVSHIEVLLAW
jgi:hypothetical protein